MRKNMVKRKQVIAWICACSLSIVSLLPAKGIAAQGQAQDGNKKEHMLQNPVIAAEDGGQKSGYSPLSRE